MNTEITKIMEEADLRGWVLYDGQCPVCCRWARRTEKIVTRRGFDIAPLQSPWVQECLDIPVAPRPHEMLVLTRDGRVYGGADALAFLANHVWWAKPLAFLDHFAPVHRLLDNAYNTFAANRTCLGDACSAQKR